MVDSVSGDPNNPGGGEVIEHAGEVNTSRGDGGSDAGMPLQILQLHGDVHHSQLIDLTEASLFRRFAASPLRRTDARCGAPAGSARPIRNEPHSICSNPAAIVIAHVACHPNWSINPATITVRPAAGPLTCSGEPPRLPATMPPTAATISPAITGTLERLKDAGPENVTAGRYDRPRGHLMAMTNSCPLQPGSLCSRRVNCCGCACLADFPMLAMEC